MTIRTGIGFDAHRLVHGRPLVLGGVTIEHERGLAGHSDADVLCHAVADALLGAMADGDIGTHFPDSDERWRGADSLALLRRVVRRLREAGARPSNLDATVIAEQPKLAPHIAAMRARLAEAAGLATSAVSVKSTTVEQMGALGRREGIAALAVATVIVGDEA